MNMKTLSCHAKQWPIYLVILFSLVSNVSTRFWLAFINKTFCACMYYITRCVQNSNGLANNPGISSNADGSPHRRLSFGFVLLGISCKMFWLVGVLDILSKIQSVRIKFSVFSTRYGQTKLSLLLIVLL